MPAGTRPHGRPRVPGHGPGAAIPDLLSELQVKLVTSGDSVDVANEINDLINKL